ncbi:MAG: gliding motility-associated C-terminal domain-containing protein [Flavobacteriales bacterium]
MNFFSTAILFTLMIFSHLTVNSQSNVVLCLGQDATVCAGQTVTINNCNTGANPGTSAGLYLNAPSSVSLSDDSWSGAVAIGFPFSFYGTSYSQCVIGSNGLISFNLTNAGGYCPWSLSGVTPLPNMAFTSARNSIMLTYEDMNPSLGGQIQYQTIGTAPNRKFVVLYKNIMMFGCTTQCNYMAIVLYETSNIFELHIGNKPICGTWNGSLAIQGSENNPMTVANITPGRNVSVWSANQDGRRFLPAAPSNTNTYTISQIPYVMVNSPGSNFVWANTLGQSFPYNNGTLNVNPVPSGTTGYFLSGAACGTSVGSITQDTTWITVSNPTMSTTTVPDICSQHIGSATAVPGPSSPPPYTYLWSNGATTATATGLAAGTYTVTVVNGNGCTATGTAVITDNPATFNSTTTPVSCPGGSDGTATAIVTPITGAINYQWSNGQTTQTATGLSAGNYWCFASTATGCVDTIYVTITEIPAMILTMTNIVDANCYTIANGQATVNVTQGTPNYTYSWSGSTASAATALDLGAGLHTVTVTDMNGCVQTMDVTISQPNPLSISFLTQDTMICSEDAILLTATGAGGSSAYNYSWTEDGLPIGNGGSITVDPINSGTVYCVTLSEACGSPITTECMTITFPLEIIPSTVPDHAIRCLPGDFVFSNTSTNGGDIASTQYIFSNGDSFTVNALDPLPETLPNPGTYSVDMIVTSIHGCIYQGHYQDIVEVTPLPTADFTMSKSPLTWFETTVQTNDISSGNIASYDWSSVGATNVVNNGGSAMITYPEGVMGTYHIMLVVTTNQGCSDSAIYEIQVVSDVIFYAPTAFTPDDDEHNQVWLFYVEGIDKENFELTIHNRWGEVVWETHDVNSYWDGYYNGQKVQPGIYTWKAWYKELDNDGKSEKSGIINVIR